MEPEALIIYVWVALVPVIVSYVAYRLITDRRGNGKRHPLYPFVSRPSDGVLPSKSEPIARLAYFIITVSLCMFLGLVAFELFGLKPPSWATTFFGSTLLVGLGLMAIGLLKRQSPK